MWECLTENYSLGNHLFGITSAPQTLLSWDVNWHPTRNWIGSEVKNAECEGWYPELWKGGNHIEKLAEFTPCCNEEDGQLYLIHCVFKETTVTDYWQKVFFLFFLIFSVLPVRAPDLTMQCAQIKSTYLCWTVDWTWLLPSTSFLCHLFRGMYWFTSWNRLSFDLVDKRSPVASRLQVPFVLSEFTLFP